MEWSEFLAANQTHIPQFEIALRLLSAALLGGAIGFEREVRDRPAGLKTHMLTSLAASVFTILTFEIFHAVRALEPHPTVDPIRVIEAVTAGVAFLAAGTIIQSRGRVRGLTTGAGIWMAGAVGVASGAGYFLLAFAASLLSVAIFVAVKRLERRFLDREKNPEDL